MAKKYYFIIFLSSLLFLYSCSRKSHPAKTPPENAALSPENSPDSSAAKKAAFKPTRKDIIPNSIVVNDSVARKSVDGRLYYDLLKHRYWKNYKDGKYYLFNKSMYSNDAFKKPE